MIPQLQFSEQAASGSENSYRNRRTTTGAKASIGLELYAALKRRSSTVSVGRYQSAR